MSLSYAIDPAGFLRVVAGGFVTADDLARHVTAVRADPEAGRLCAVLFDLRPARPAIGYAELVIFRDFLATAVADCRLRRWAILVETEVGYGLARMFSTLAEGLPIEIEICTELAAAEAWLAGELDQV